MHTVAMLCLAPFEGLFRSGHQFQSGTTSKVIGGDETPPKLGPPVVPLYPFLGGGFPY